MESVYTTWESPAKRFNDYHRSEVLQPVTKRPRVSVNTSRTFRPASSTFTGHQFTLTQVHKCLYDQTEPREVSLERVGEHRPAKQLKNDCFWCGASFAEPKFKCPLHQQNKPAIQLPLALKSLPPEVGLCVSSIHSAGYGICAKREIPAGAWIGPYEGKFLKPEELSSVSDTSFMWEVYEDDKLAGFIDGSDETVSSWMRYIRCARHKQEQNLFAFQYMGKVYYRSFKAILPGHEMLVWYDEKYPQYLGIPSSIFDLGSVIPSGSSSQPNELIVVSPRDANYQPTQSSCFPSPPPSPLSPSSFPQTSSLSPTNGALRPFRPISDENIFLRKTSVPDFARNRNQFVASPDKLGKMEDGHNSSVISSDRHEQSPTQLTLWKCGQCKSVFPQRSMLQIHLCTQAPKKPYQCGHCPESFPDPTQLSTHALIHAGKKPFKCGYCSRSFTGAMTLNNHIAKHTGDRDSTCAALGKTFKQGSQLRKNQRISDDCMARD